MEFGRGDDFGELLHVVWLNVDDVERLIGDLDVPEIDSQIIRGDVGLSVAIGGDRVDVVSVGVGEDFFSLSNETQFPLLKQMEH